MFKIETLTLLMIIIALGLKKHRLTTLLLLEILCLFIVITSLKNGIEIFFRLILICVGACEGAVGLGALIRMSRMEKRKV